MIFDGKHIVEATEAELVDWYYKVGMDDIYTFEEYVERLRDGGTKITNREEG